MVYPRNNFATDAKYWGREVEKKITNLESSLQNSDINNTTRDSQLSVTSNQALIAANDAKAAAQSTADIINNIYSAGTTEINGGVIKSGTITANEISANYVYAGNIMGDQITGGLITGTTIQTAGSSKIILNSSNNSLGFTDSSGNPSAHIFPGASESGTDGIYMSYGTGPNINAGNLLNLTNNGFFLKAGSGNSSSISGGAGGLFLSSTGSGNKVSIEATAGCEISGGLKVDSLTNSGGYGGNGFPSVALNTVSGTTTFAPNVFISGSGNMARNTTASERRAKESIEQLEFDTEAFIAINPVKFNYKREAVSDDSQAEAVNLGFILDDFEDAGIDEFLVAAPQEGDEYKQLRYQILYMYLHKVVQTQNETIKTLEARLDALEAE